MSTRNATVRRFCFTWNNYTDTDVVTCETFINQHCKYGIFGKELSTSGTPHLQGFCNLQKPMRFSTIKQHLDNRVHIEKAIGSDLENQTYCSKAGLVFEKGTPCSQGRRSDLDAIVETIQAGERNERILAEKHATAYIKFYRGIRQYLEIAHPIKARDFKTDVYYYWGPPGSGKSRRALEEARATNAESIYYKPRGLWWDGYNQQECVIIDDFYGWIKYDEILKICDRYPYKVQIKGGFQEFTSKKIWFTSNIDTLFLYKFQGYDAQAFERRITNKIHLL
ncbi:Rep [bat associated cyclovirus Cg1]|uniref:Replication-associated protein n=1 Tax=bat associated cyclovirus Cg1 TaxID=3070182 RepID=A0AA48XT86_9CIRC|nr:Rep [Bat associated cyclovirus]UBK24588.1 Rep [bat associated cyclovirus Cg1]